jgi:hypothetical protein
VDDRSDDVWIKPGIYLSALLTFTNQAAQQFPHATVRTRSNLGDSRVAGASCHRGEERAVRAYQQALDALPDECRWEVSAQYQSMRSTLAKLRAWLEDKETRPQRS